MKKTDRFSKVTRMFCIWLFAFIVSPKIATRSLMENAENREQHFHIIEAIDEAALNSSFLDVCFSANYKNEVGHFSTRVNLEKDLATSDGMQNKNTKVVSSIWYILVENEMISPGCDFINSEEGNSVANVNIESRRVNWANIYLVDLFKDQSGELSIILPRGEQNRGEFIVGSKDLIAHPGYRVVKLLPDIGKKDKVWLVALPFAVLFDGLLSPLEWLFYLGYSH